MNLLHKYTKKRQKKDPVIRFAQIRSLNSDYFFLRMINLKLQSFISNFHFVAQMKEK